MTEEAKSHAADESYVMIGLTSDNAACGAITGQFASDDLFVAGKYKEPEQAKEQRKQRKQEIEDEKSKVKENLSAFFSTTDTEGNKKLIRSYNRQSRCF